MTALNRCEQKLVALGAAIASNCLPCVEYHIPEARNAGLTDNQIREAVEIADKVRRFPARMVLEAAFARIEARPGGSTASASAVCGCTGSNQDSEPACGD